MQAPTETGQTERGERQQHDCNGVKDHLKPINNTEHSPNFDCALTANDENAHNRSAKADGGKRHDTAIPIAQNITLAAAKRARKRETARDFANAVHIGANHPSSRAMQRHVAQVGEGHDAETKKELLTAAARCPQCNEGASKPQTFPVQLQSGVSAPRDCVAVDVGHFGDMLCVKFVDAFSTEIHW